MDVHVEHVARNVRKPFPLDHKSQLENLSQLGNGVLGVGHRVAEGARVREDLKVVASLCCCGRMGVSQ